MTESPADETAAAIPAGVETPNADADNAEAAAQTPAEAQPGGPAEQDPESKTAQDGPVPDTGANNAKVRPGDPLTDPSTAQAARSTRYTNDGWRTSTSLQNPRTGVPIKMEYQLPDGAGKVRLQRHNGRTCEGDVEAGIKDGKLVIDSTGNIVCADGTNFGRPTLECKPRADGKADCVGRYPTGETFSVDIGRGLRRGADPAPARGLRADDDKIRLAQPEPEMEFDQRISW